jgi:Flp pilus assembly protein protease CpaA
MQPELLLTLPIVVLAAYAGYTDLKRREIDDWVPIFIALYGTIMQLLYFNRLPEAIFCAIVVFSMLFVVYLASKGGLGGGDVKLLTSLAFFFGFNSFAVVMIACVIAAAYGIIQAIATRQGLKTESPFAPAVFLSVFLAAIFL